MPNVFSVSGSPVTTSGTLAVTLATETANRVWSGPATGSPATPTFRALVAADLPAGTGTVTSVALTVPNFLSVSGSPVTTSGTLAVTLATETANTLFAGPTTGGATTPTFRAMVGADLVAFTGDVTNSGAAMTVAKIQGTTVSGTTGTTNVAFSASPTFTGTITAAAANFSGSVGLNGGCTGLVEVFTGLIAAGADGSYTIDQSAAYAYTINTIIVATDSGTATLAVKIGSTAVTGISAVSVSSTPATGTASAANSVSIGDKVLIALSSSSTPVNLAFTLKVTRA